MLLHKALTQSFPLDQLSHTRCLALLSAMITLLPAAVNELSTAVLAVVRSTRRRT
jgi:hypothetical protein